MFSRASDLLRAKDERVEWKLCTEVCVKSIRAASEVIFVLKVSRNFLLGVPSLVAKGMEGPRYPQI